MLAWGKSTIRAFAGATATSDGIRGGQSFFRHKLPIVSSNPPRLFPGLAPSSNDAIHRATPLSAPVSRCGLKLARYPRLTRSYPRRFAFYAANPVGSIPQFFNIEEDLLGALAGQLRRPFGVFATLRAGVARAQTAICDSRIASVCTGPRDCFTRELPFQSRRSQPISHFRRAESKDWRLLILSCHGKQANRRRKGVAILTLLLSGSRLMVENFLVIREL
jgi:hypothetical protein